MDVEGNGRPFGPAYDVSAHEFGSVSRPGADTTPPGISNVRVSNVKRRSVSVTWMTDEVSTTAVHYGRTAASADPTFKTAR